MPPTDACSLIQFTIYVTFIEITLVSLSRHCPPQLCANLHDVSLPSYSPFTLLMLRQTNNAQMTRQLFVFGKESTN